MGGGSPKRAERALGVPGSAPQVQVLSLRPEKAERTKSPICFFLFLTAELAWAGGIENPKAIDPLRWTQGMKNCKSTV